MKTLLINPPTGLFVREDRCQSAVGDFAVSFLRPPHDLMLIASSIRDTGVKCFIRDYPVEGKSWDYFKKDLYDFSPDILILSVTTPSLKEDLKACKIAKEINPKIITIAKGAHFNLDDSGILKGHNELDIVVRNESFLAVKEIALNKKLEDIKGITFRHNGKIIRNPDRDFLDNLDNLPIPARELIDNNLYVRPDTGQPMAVIETTRGCPYECIFCLASQVSGKKLRKRSPQVIVDEIEECIRDFNIRNFHFKSDTFTYNKEWVKALCAEIIERDLDIEWICNSRVDTIDMELVSLMKKAGCFAIGFGVESANQMILDRIKKGTTAKEAKKAITLCKNARILSYAYFMIGFPWDTNETVSDSISFAIELDPDFVDFFIAYPFPGTALEEIARSDGLLKESSANVKAYAMPSLKTYKLSEVELHKMRKLALRRFYLRPNYIVKTLLKAGSFGKIRNYLKEGSRVFSNVLYPVREFTDFSSRLSPFKVDSGMKPSLSQTTRPITKFFSNRVKEQSSLTGLTENSEIIKALEANSRTPNYNKWIFDNLKNFLGENILEIGAGIGNITTYIAENKDAQLILTEILDEFLAVLKKRYSSRDNVKIFKCNVLDEEFVEIVSNFDIDTVLCINVLEHLQDDLKALRHIRKIIKKEAHLVILVPAFNFLYSRWDSVIGHYKRYTRQELLRLMNMAGFRIKKAYYMNFMGFFAWFFSAKILNLSPAQSNGVVSKQAIFFDNYAVNALSFMEGIVRPPFGLSVFAVGTPE